MEWPYVCESRKYTILPNNTICLPLSILGLPKEIQVKGQKLLLKGSFHVSLVCINEIVRKQKIDDVNFRDSVISDFCNFIKDNPIELIKYSENYRYCEQNDKKSLIVFCDVFNLDKFFEFLNQKYKLRLECPPTHVTIYALDGKRGIFLTDSEDLKNFTEEIHKPEGIFIAE